MVRDRARNAVGARLRFAVILGILHAGIASVAWFLILGLPLEQPFAGLYAAERQTTGWAPAWVAPAAAAVVITLVAWRLSRSSESDDWVWAARTGALCGFMTLVTCNVVRNFAYAMAQPSVDALVLIAVLPQMIFKQAVWSLVAVVSENAWSVLALGAGAGLIASGIAGTSMHAGIDVSATRAISDELRITQVARAGSAVAMAALTLVALLPAMGPSALLVAIITGYAWWAKGVPDGSVEWSAMISVGISAPILSYALVKLILEQLWLIPAGSLSVGTFVPIVLAAPLLIGVVLRRIARSA